MTVDAERHEPALDELVDLLTLERLEVDLFRGKQADTPLQRVFGGQVAGQALVAAGTTVAADRPVHSLHAYFLRPGDNAVPIVYAVDRLRDGRTFTTRRVVALQNGKAIFSLTASFCLPGEGVQHQVEMPSVPAPESLPTLPQRMSAYAAEDDGWWVRERPIDLRYVGMPPRLAMDNPGDNPAYNQVWLRTRAKLPDDPLLHVCTLTYASDMSLLDSVLTPHHLALGKGTLELASLDHAMWFHRPFRADEWLLYDQNSPSAFEGRGFAQGRIFRADGALAVSVVQEGLLRHSL